MTFVLRFPENNGRNDGTDPWSIRQAGIYQSFNSTTKSVLWILLSSRRGNSADGRIRRLLYAQESMSRLQRQPPLVGLIVLSTSFTNWRTYMAFYEEEELRLVGSIFRYLRSYVGLDLILPLSQELSLAPSSTNSSNSVTPHYQV